jgi:hypothetical protein
MSLLQPNENPPPPPPHVLLYVMHAIRWLLYQVKTTTSIILFILYESMVEI